MRSCLLEFCFGQGLWESSLFCRDGTSQVYRTPEMLSGGLGCREEFGGGGNGEKREHSRGQCAHLQAILSSQ